MVFLGILQVKSVKYLDCAETTCRHEFERAVSHAFCEHVVMYLLSLQKSDRHHNMIKTLHIPVNQQTLPTEFKTADSVPCSWGTATLIREKHNATVRWFFVNTTVKVASHKAAPVNGRAAQPGWHVNREGRWKSPTPELDFLTQGRFLWNALSSPCEQHHLLFGLWNCMAVLSYKSRDLEEIEPLHFCRQCCGPAPCTEAVGISTHQ